ncbi:MAG: PhoU domain-containing protein, partial [Candidatus Promineifilaceae bacterium]
MAFATRTTFDRELQALDDDIVKMGSMVDWAIENGMKSLYERDMELAREVIAGDEAINALRYEIEER